MEEDEEVELPGDKKIGITGKDDATLDGRFQQLSATKGPIGVRCLAAWEIEDAAKHERLLHQLLSGLRLTETCYLTSSSAIRNPDVWILSFIDTEANLYVLSMIRIVRLVRLVRMIKLVRMFQGVYVMVTAFANAVRSMAILLCMMAFGLLVSGLPRTEPIIGLLEPFEPGPL